MKKESVTVQIDGEKLKATKRYLAKKNLDLTTELEKDLLQLYQKYVPAQVREYIEDCESVEFKTKTKVKSQAVADVTAFVAE